MCGIIACLGTDDCIHTIMDGLELMQNRGYDSVGVSTIINNELHTIKMASTTTCNAFKLVKESVLAQNSSIAIGHTRWATHGGKTDVNAHPHHDDKNRIALVHNGIIENFMELKTMLLQKGYTFRSQTDTEVIAVLIGMYLDQHMSVSDAIQHALQQLSGTWALVIIHRDIKNTIWVTRNGSPLLIGKGDTCCMIASEKCAFGQIVQTYISLDNNDIVEVTLTDGLIHYNQNLQKYTSYDIKATTHYMKTHEHWMLSEIMEQPDSILRAINYGGRIESDTTVKLGGLDSYTSPLLELDHLMIIGCGTSYHAGWWAMSLFKSLRIMHTISVYDGAECTYHDIPTYGKTGMIVLSQSGETKDIYTCLQMAKEHHLLTIGVINVVDSLLARETDCGVYIHAGREVAVASTKSFTNQCIILSMIAVWFSQNRKTCIEQRRSIISDLRNISYQVQLMLQNHSILQTLSKTLAQSHHLFILGKGSNEAIANEGSLKLKEIGYLHAEGYSSSALKHGPFALLQDTTPVILLDLGETHRSKNLNAYQEVSARQANVYCITDDPSKRKSQLWIERNHTYGGLLASIYLQLLSYYIAIEKGHNPDFPRNLAKVVTVD